MECEICNVSAKKERLFEVISRKGVVMLCAECAEKENYPVLKKPTTFQLKEAEKKQRLVFKPKGKLKKNPVLDKENTSLRDLVERNYESNSKHKKKPRPDLATNFHWIVMRARRNKKLTPGQLAKEISESETAIKMAEKGILPEDDYRLVNKLESFLGVKIRKHDFKKPEKSPARILKFDKFSLKNITIDDLKKLKRKKEQNIFTDSKSKNEDVDFDKDESNKESNNNEEDEDIIEIENKDDDELSQEDINKIIFKGK